MTDHTFTTETPVDLYVEIGKGNVTIRTADTRETTVIVEGDLADEVAVRQEGRAVHVVGPKGRLGFLGGSEHHLDIAITVPHQSRATVKTGSADITCHGELDSCHFRTGSGDIRVEDLTGTGVIETGSGDVRIGAASAELRIKSGSGDIQIDHTGASTTISTGSGDVSLGTTAAAVAVKTGSGDVTVAEAGHDVALSTGSGDLVVRTARRGKFTVKGASGDVRLGIPSGTPVWTDINTLSGRIDSNLQGTGEPAEGQDHIEVRAKTASGNVVLRQV
ncbi:DUF4097 family beta strand repeat-containing protein [Nocardioides sp. LHG3406-4]|uniref:DUF4097 family beta strand repeat-containing protein n=1 Tax=Nocardioides sp. LHG3406-4 TaxID=2804575 RepID=UPI003CE99EC8